MWNLFKINNRETETISQTCSKSIKKTQSNVWEFFKVNKKVVRTIYQTLAKISIKILEECVKLVKVKSKVKFFLVKAKTQKVS